jgi:hypothetical protein
MNRLTGLRRLTTTRLGATIAAICLLGAGVIAPIASPATAWASGCDETSPANTATAAYWAATGQFSTPTDWAWVDGTTSNKVELRYNAAARCAWGLYTGGMSAVVYIDRSIDGGASHLGPMGTSGPATSTYTGVFNDGAVPGRPGLTYAVRACASYSGKFYCTGWY